MSSVLERAVQGNRTAMHRVYEKERKLLYFLCLRLSANETEAADAAGGETSAAEGLLRRADQSVKRQLSLLKFKVGLSNAPTAREIDGLLRTITAETLVPDELDAEAAAIILRASHPARVNPILIAAVVCLFLAAGLWLASAFTGGESTQDNSVSSSVSDGASVSKKDGTAAKGCCKTAASNTNIQKPASQGSGKRSF